MSHAHVVVVEDEPAIRRGVVDVLKVSSYKVSEAVDGEAGLVAACGRGVDLVLLDLALPKIDGMQVLAELRRLRPTIPVIILTARGGEEDRVRGLRMGADDYVVKPFSARELLARVEAVLRRSPQRPPAVGGARLGALLLDLNRREIRQAKNVIGELSETETTLLSYLLMNRDRTVSREELLTWLWGFAASGAETRAIDMHVARLRAKLIDPQGTQIPEAVVTVRSRGYMAGPELVPVEAAP